MKCSIRIKRVTYIRVAVVAYINYSRYIKRDNSNQFSQRYKKISYALKKKMFFFPTQ